MSSSVSPQGAADLNRAVSLDDAAYDYFAEVLGGSSETGRCYFLRRFGVIPVTSEFTLSSWLRKIYDSEGILLLGGGWVSVTAFPISADFDGRVVADFSVSVEVFPV